MSNSVVRGIVPRSDAIEVPDDLWRNLRRLANGAGLCLNLHSNRMKSDPEYRAAVEQFAKRLMDEVPGRLGKTVRIMDAGHTLLVKVL